MSDIRVFLVFFTLMTLFCSMIFNIISINEASEYRNVSKFWGNFLNVMRLSLGDFGFDLLDKHEDPKFDLNVKQHIMFWIIWLIMVIFTSLIFLNFIIAEVCNSYQVINENLDAIIYKERAALIWKIEEIFSKDMKKKDKKAFPKFLVVREYED